MKKYIQVIGVISSLAVVLLHTNGVFWIFSYERYWFTANIIECICYFAVPVFFMISGCNLIDYTEKYTTKIYMKKRITKTVIPFLIWSIIGCIYLVFTHVYSLSDLTLINVINGVINTKFPGIYWFFMPLFSIYLCIPALSFIEKKNREHIFKYLILAAFALNILLPFICIFLPIDYNGNLNLSMVGGYLFFALVGYYIDNYKIEKRFRYMIYISGIFGLFTHIIGTLYLSYSNGAINETFKGYLNLPCVLYSVSIFLLFKYLDTKKIMSLLSNITRFFSDTTFGIYLIHWFIMDSFLRITGINSTSIIFRILGGVGIFIVSALIIKILKKLPVLKHIVP